MKITLNDIFYATLEAWDTDEETYRNIKDSRERLALSIRQVVCWIGQGYGYSQPQIGQYLGITHSTVCHNKKICEDYMTYDARYKSIVNKAVELLCEKEGICIGATISGFVSRDEDGELTLWNETPPVREFYSNGVGFWCGECPRELEPTLFPQITWETGPQECEIKITLKDEHRQM